MTRRAVELPVLAGARARGPRGVRGRVQRRRGAHGLARRGALVRARQARPRGRGGPGVGGAARPRVGDQGARAHAPRRVSRAVRGQRAARTGCRCTGRATRTSTTGSCTGCSTARGVAPAREEQVDAHRGVRPQPVSRVARHRGGRHRPRRVDRPASRRGARATSCCRRSTSRRRRSATLFHEHLGTPAGLTDPTSLAEAAREHLREKFLAADAGLTGVNFAVAETGGFVVCTNEGNADLGTALAPLHIACMGIEKLIPRVEDLGVFLRLLARSGDGAADHRVHARTSTARARAGAAHRAGRQRPHAAARARGVLAARSTASAAARA